jgi:AraC family transcriptional activator of tynA and feaB
MLQSGDFAGTPHLDYEAWRAWLHSNCGGNPEVSEPKAFAGWTRPLSVCGFAATALKIQCGLAAMDLGRNACRIERTHRDVRRAGADDYSALFQVAGRSRMTQNDQAVELAGGDVVLVDTSRPSTLSHNRSGQWLSLHLRRQSLISHLGFEPKGDFCRGGGTLATRVLSQLVRDAIEDEASPSAQASTYMQLAVYDLIGAIFAPSDPIPGSLHTDKLFARICGIIKDRFADPDLGASEIAAEAGISLRYLQQLFTARGSTCTHFIHSLRLDHAARLMHRRALLGTGQPLREIAYACGFNDYAHFARKFRHRFGYSPRAHGEGHGQRSDA